MTRRKPPEPVEIVRARRNTALETLAQSIPYVRQLGVTFDRRGDEVTATLHYAARLIGNPLIPALHGGAIGAFLEIAAIVELAWSQNWERMEALEGAVPPELSALPKTIDFSVDYLRSGLPRDVFARARVTRSGRRYASVFVEGWQDNRLRPIAQATGHFLMPPQPEVRASP
jgi:acyl-coenzyme A thioesterase PaaI-like protein